MKPRINFKFFLSNLRNNSFAIVISTISLIIFFTIIYFALHFFGIFPSKKTVYVIYIDSEISYDSLQVEKLIKFLKESKADGYLFYINSPGGEVLASYKIAKAVSELKVPTVCYIRNYGTSGAYWIASQCDKIISEPFSIVGSIGVTASYLEFSGLLNKLGIKYVRLVEGKYKDTLTPYRNITPEEMQLIKEKLKIIYDYFKHDVLKKRPFINKSALNGEFYLGVEAKKLGLVDKIGDFDDAKKEIAKMLNTTVDNIDFVSMEFKVKKSIFDLLFNIKIPVSILSKIFLYS